MYTYVVLYPSKIRQPGHVETHSNHIPQNWMGGSSTQIALACTCVLFSPLRKKHAVAVLCSLDEHESARHLRDGADVHAVVLWHVCSYENALGERPIQNLRTPDTWVHTSCPIVYTHVCHIIVQLCTKTCVHYGCRIVYTYVCTQLFVYVCVVCVCVCVYVCVCTRVCVPWHACHITVQFCTATSVHNCCRIVYTYVCTQLFVDVLCACVCACVPSYVYHAQGPEASCWMHLAEWTNCAPSSSVEQTCDRTMSFQGDELGLLQLLWWRHLLT